MVGVLEITRAFRIPFPLFPTLKFDIVGIPMVIAYFLFGLAPGVSTSMESFALIAYRDPFSGAMKALAEYTTILGISLVLRRRTPGSSNGRRALAIGSGVALRVVVMSVANIVFLPVFMPGYYQTPMAVAAVIHFIAAFNAVQGLVSSAGGFFLYEAVTRRIPWLKS